MIDIDVSLTVVQKRPLYGDEYTYRFEFIPNEDFTEVTVMVAEKYLGRACISAYYRDQPEYSNAKPGDIKMNKFVHRHIVEFYENPNIQVYYK